MKPYFIDIMKMNVIDDGYMPVKLSTDRGEIDTRYYESNLHEMAVIFVGGVGGGFDSPAKELYPRLCLELLPMGISSLRVAFRHPTDLDESILDVLAGLSFLKSKGARAVCLVGHSFGGAVVINSAVHADIVNTVITLATQCFGADAVAKLKQGCSILLIHGSNDQVLPPYCSSMVYDKAHEPKRLLIYEGAGHGLDESAEKVHKAVFDWITDWIKGKR